ncbi:MAG TPA: acetoacetate decarboxylase family protein [Mycobacteriales bacterium]|nr:acetoacetate decarboxylase family protein [Mycobacteriales bacterium]
MTVAYAVTAAAGMPETELPDSLLEQLPATVAPAPWNTHCDVVSWLHPVGPEAVVAFPAVIRPAAVALAAWALVRYRETPVGPYQEIAVTLFPDGGDGYGHIPFIAVDSLASIVGGRTNWLLPKALASFDWSEDGRAVTIRGSAPATPAWSISVRHAPADDPTPFAAPSLVEQVSTEGLVGRFEAELNGALTATTVEVDGHADGPLAALLRPGRFDGSAMSGCRFDVGPLTG